MELGLFFAPFWFRGSPENSPFLGLPLSPCRPRPWGPAVWGSAVFGSCGISASHLQTSVTSFKVPSLSFQKLPSLALPAAFACYSHSRRLPTSLPLSVCLSLSYPYSAVFFLTADRCFLHGGHDHHRGSKLVTCPLRSPLSTAAEVAPAPCASPGEGV